MAKKVTPYKTPAACYERAPVRRETTVEYLWRQRHALLDLWDIHKAFVPHEGSIPTMTRGARNGRESWDR